MDRVLLYILAKRTRPLCKTLADETQMINAATTLFLLFYRPGFLGLTDPESRIYVT